MPLSKLFHKRGSQKKKKLSSDTACCNETERRCSTDKNELVTEKAENTEGCVVDAISEEHLIDKNQNSDDSKDLLLFDENSDMKAVIGSCDGSKENSSSDAQADHESGEKENLTESGEGSNLNCDSSTTQTFELYKSKQLTESEKKSMLNRRTSLPEKCVSSEVSKRRMRSESVREGDTVQFYSLMQKRTNPELAKIRVRSASDKTNHADQNGVKSHRRKCVSESEATNISENAGEKIIQLKQKDLEEVIGRCVNKLLQDSILTAVKSVNVDNLYEEIVKDFSDRQHSDSSESKEDVMVKGKLSNDSISESIELEVEEISEEREQEKENEVSCSVVTSEEDRISAEECGSFDWEVEEVKDNVEGYSADFEESISLHSMTSESSAEKSDPQKIKTSETTVFKATDFQHEKNNLEEVSIKNSADENETDGTASLKNYSKDSTKSNKEIEKSKNFLDGTSEDDSPVLKAVDSKDSVKDLSKDASQKCIQEDEKKINWKVGYLQVKLPHKTRGKGHLKVWKKRCVAIQPDEFVNDPQNPCLMISVYSAESGTSRKHNAVFWQAVSGKKAVVYRSSSRSHKYAFTISDDNTVVIHLAADSESSSQEWMAAIRAILWPPSSVIQLEKMLNGREFEISIIDNEFSYRAGLLGMYGYLTITSKKLILVHPQQGYVIQEWYLNTVDKFQLMPQAKQEDANKVLSMTTCSDSSTGKGDILIFCNEAIALLQSLASTIHDVLAHHSKQEGGKYQKELEEIAEWLVAPPSQPSDDATEDYYKVPPRQVKSLLDIPNFIFKKPLTPVASAVCTTAASPDVPESTLETCKSNPTTTSHDSGISAGNSTDDFLNCSVTSFVVGGGPLPGKSSDSEDLSDAYTPPRSPDLQKKLQTEKAEPVQEAES